MYGGLDLLRERLLMAGREKTPRARYWGHRKGQAGGGVRVLVVSERGGGTNGILGFLSVIKKAVV